MKILYSAIGTTDPIRGCYDGGMLHIVRHYKPDMVVLFLSKEMVAEEERNQQYTKAISYVNSNCKVELIKTDLENVHKIDALYSLVDEFYHLYERFPDAEFLINLTSGTPQMCQLMTYLAIENSRAIGIQVDTPTERSNRTEHALQGNEDIDYVIECNFDNEEGSQYRCHEPSLQSVKRRFLKERCISLVKAYEYRQALQVFKEYKTLAEEQDKEYIDVIGKLLQHSMYRSAFEYDTSLTYIPKELKQSLTHSIPSSKVDIRNLIEYLYIAQIRIEKGMYQDFIVKLTPYLFQFMKCILRDMYGVNFRNIEIRGRKGMVDHRKLSKEYPELYKSWERSMNQLNYETKDFELSFFHMLNMIQFHPYTRSDLVNSLKLFTPILKNIRNIVAHEIATITQEDIREASEGKDCQEILANMRSMMEQYMNIPKPQLKLVYTLINDKIIQYFGLMK